MGGERGDEEGEAHDATYDAVFARSQPFGFRFDDEIRVTKRPLLVAEILLDGEGMAVDALSDGPSTAVASSVPLTPSSPSSSSSLAPSAAFISSPLDVGDDGLKESWEDYELHELEALWDREVIVRLSCGGVRRVCARLFENLEGTPIHVILFDRRWANRGELDCCAEIFDDICLFLKDGRTLPPEQPKCRREHLRNYAQFYCLEALVGALDDEALRLELEAARRPATGAAAEPRRKTRQRWRSQQWRGAGEDRAKHMLEEFETWSQRCPTKAQGLRSVLQGVQRAFAENRGPRNGYNRQLHLSAQQPKGSRNPF